MNYNKSISALLVAMLIASTSGAKTVQLSDTELQEIKKTNKLFQRSNIKIIDGIDEGKSYFLQLEVKGRRGSKIINGYIEKDTGHLFTGSRYDANGIKATYPKTAKSIETIKKGVSFSYGSGAKELYIVTDPECSFCVKLEKETVGKLDDYTVHVVLYPLSFHKKAPAMVEWIMQGKDDAEKYHRMEELMVKGSKDYEVLMPKKGEPFKYTDSIKVSIDNAVRAAKALGATGTPSIYDDTFSKIDLKSILAKKAAATKEIQQFFLKPKKP